MIRSPSPSARRQGKGIPDRKHTPSEGGLSMVVSVITTSCPCGWTFEVPEKRIGEEAMCPGWSSTCSASSTPITRAIRGSNLRGRESRRDATSFPLLSGFLLFPVFSARVWSPLLRSHLPAPVQFRCFGNSRAEKLPCSRYTLQEC
jgi:hypothetical protein